MFGGSGGEPSRVYRQRPDGTFRGAAVDAVAPANEAAVAAAIFDADGDGWADIWLAVREAVGSETDSVAASGVRGTAAAVSGAAVPGPVAYKHRLYRNEEGAGFREAAGAVPGLADAGAVLVPGDYDGDGDVDLFVGSRTVPGSEPAAGSRLLRNEDGVFRDVTSHAARALARLGTITDALWAEVNGDGALDLVVVGEWLPVTVLRNDDDVLGDATPAAGLDGLTGWWQSVAAADFDGDGDVDLVAGNMGLNYPYAPAEDAPFELYIHDFSGSGRDATVPAYYEAGQHYPWIGRTNLARALPSLLDRYPTNDAFARATLPEILGAGALRSARRLEVRTLATTYLENVGEGRFRARQLPRAAQVSPVAGIVPADFDGDGAIDLVLAGNLHALDSRVPRADAGVGLFLRGDGTGDFRPVMPMQSGLLLEGEVRRLAGIRVVGHRSPGLVAAITGVGAVHVRAVSGTPTLASAPSGVPVSSSDSVQMPRP